MGMNSRVSLLSVAAHSRYVHTAGDLVSFAPVASIGIENGVAEIVAATPDGTTPVYTDSDNESIGLVDSLNLMQIRKS